MSYILYKVIHLFGIFLVLLSLGAIASHSLQGGRRAGFKNRKFFMGLHGLGLLLAFIAGFGLISKGGFGFSNGWIYIKIFIWLCLGIYPLIFYRQKSTSRKPFFILLGLLILAILSVELQVYLARISHKVLNLSQVNGVSFFGTAIHGKGDRLF